MPATEIKLADLAQELQAVRAELADQREVVDQIQTQVGRCYLALGRIMDGRAGAADELLAQTTLRGELEPILNALHAVNERLDRARHAPRRRPPGIFRRLAKAISPPQPAVTPLERTDSGETF